MIWKTGAYNNPRAKPLLTTLRKEVGEYYYPKSTSPTGWLRLKTTPAKEMNGFHAYMHWHGKVRNQERLSKLLILWSLRTDVDPLISSYNSATYIPIFVKVWEIVPHHDKITSSTRYLTSDADKKLKTLAQWNDVVAQSGKTRGNDEDKGPNIWTLSGKLQWKIVLSLLCL